MENCHDLDRAAGLAIHDAVVPPQHLTKIRIPELRHDSPRLGESSKSLYSIDDALGNESAIMLRVPAGETR